MLYKYVAAGCSMYCKNNKWTSYIYYIYMLNFFPDRWTYAFCNNCLMMITSTPVWS